MHIIRQSGAAQLQHRRDCPLGVPAAEEEEIPLIAGKLRTLAQIDPVGIADDGGLFRLPKHLTQKDRFDFSAADEIGEHVPRAHGGELVGIPHQHKARAGTQRPQQRGKQRHVHHAHFVHNHGLGLQRLLFRFLERHLMGRFVPCGAEQTVNRLGLHARQLAHALGRPTRGRR